MSATTNEATFWRHVDKSQDGCWLWTGGVVGGVGNCLFRLKSGDLIHQAHRVAYALLVRQVPKHARLVQSCGNDLCVNPAHRFIYQGVGAREHYRKWRRGHTEQVKAYHRTWEAKNREHVRAKQREWYGKNRGKVSAWARKRAEDDPDHAHAKRVNAKAKRRMLGVPDHITASDMRALIVRDRTCYLCGKRNTKQTRSVDHVMPLSKGGKHEFGNLRLVHLRCNLQKRDRIVLLPFEGAA